MINEDDKAVIENNLVYQLASPSVTQDTEWIKPGKISWDWWSTLNVYGVDFKAGVNTDTYKHFIDFASKYGIEYILLDDVNDSLAHARQLAHYMRGLNAYVNLIPYNSVDEHGFKPSSHVEEFKDELLRLHINCTVRKEHGRDIDGACGQLRAKRSGVI